MVFLSSLQLSCPQRWHDVAVVGKVRGTREVRRLANRAEPEVAKRPETTEHRRAMRRSIANRFTAFRGDRDASS